MRKMYIMWSYGNGYYGAVTVAMIGGGGTTQHEGEEARLYAFTGRKSSLLIAGRDRRT
jgi:hypothetical protein